MSASIAVHTYQMKLESGLPYDASSVDRQSPLLSGEEWSLLLSALRPDLELMLATGGYREGSGVRPAMESFIEEVADNVIVGVFRVWSAAPPYVFYAHVKHAQLAAQIAMADSMLQEYRGFPMLIDLADRVCGATFGTDSFYSTVQMAYARTGQPFRYLGERETRSK